ncbi:MAG: GNAT family N-acetyltransferase [Pseudomonadota bacterium]
MEVRSFRMEDAEAAGRLFHCSVREGARLKYSDAQVRAWSPDARTGPGWADRLGQADTVVAEDADGLLGFMSLTKDGYLDLAYVRPDAMGQGVSDAIYAVLEGRAAAQGITHLTVQASLLAEPFLSRKGWTVTQRQEVEMSGVVLKNAWMEKHLLVCNV